MLKIIEQFVRRMLMGKGKGILQIPPQKAVDDFANDLYKKFKQNGVSDEAITNPKDVKIVWEQITNREAQIFTNNLKDALQKPDPFKKAGEVFDLKGKKIKNPQNIMGGEEIIETEAQILKRLKNQNKEAVERLKNKKDPEDLAAGGVAGLLGERTGFRGGGGYQGSSGRSKADDRSSSRQTANNDRQTGRSSNREQGIMSRGQGPQGTTKSTTTFDPGNTGPENRSTFQQTVNTLRQTAPERLPPQLRTEPRKPPGKISRFFNSPFVRGGIYLANPALGGVMDARRAMQLKDLYDYTNASLSGDIYDEEDLTLGLNIPKTLYPQGNFLNIKANAPTQKDYNIKATKDLVENLPGGALKDVLAPAAAATLSLPYDAIQAYQRMKPGSGLTGYKNAFMAENPFSSLKERTIGAAGPLAERFAHGGPARQNFGLGGISRRAFLKWMAGAGAGIGAAKSGLFSLLKGGASKKAAVDLVTTPNVAGKPVWFDALVNKVIREGDDVSKKFGTKDLEVVHTKKINDLEEVTVTRELDTGDILVEYGPHMTDEAGKVIRASNEPGVVRFQYKKGEEIYDTGKGHLSSRKSAKEPDTFNAVESEPRITDWDGTIEMDGENVVQNIDELLTDTNKLKQYATGKNPTIRELLDGRKKQKYKQTLEENPSEQINYIEKREGMSADDILDQGAAQGDYGKMSQNYEIKGINLPEKKADGGRIGYGKGDIVTKGIPALIRALLKNKKKVKQAVDDIYPTGDYKYDAEMAADALVENNPKTFKGLLREDLDDMTSSEVYGAVLGPIQNNALMVSRMKKATKPTKTLEGIEKTGTIDISNPGIADEFTRFMKETNPKDYKNLEEKVIIESFDPKGKKGHASGGLAGMLGE